MINNTAVENKHPTEANIDTVYPITFSGATDSGGLPMFKVTLTYADGSSKELEYNVDYKLVYDDVQENNNESFNKPHLNGIKFLLPEYAVDGNTLYILRTTPFVQPVDFQIGRIDPEQIEKIADLSVLRDQEIRNQANKDRDNISDLYDITAGLRTDVDTAQETADAAMAHTVAVETRVSVNETDIATNKSAVAIAQKTASDAMAHTVAVEKRVTQAEKNITSNDGDIAKIFSQQEKQDGRLTNLENSKQDKLTAGDNIVISNNVISATGTGGAGFDAIVVQELPESGLKGVLYLVPSDGETPDVYDEYLWIESTGTFELIGKTKVDLSGYATKEDLENIDALPDQTDNAGKFLTTDGTTASWSDKPLVNNSTDSSGGLAIGKNSKAGSGMVAIGDRASADNTGVAIGNWAQTVGIRGVAIGFSATVNANRAIQLGHGTNGDANTFKVGNANGNFEMMSADGTIPAERMSATAGTTGQVLTKTDAGMEWQEASGGTTITLKEYDE